MADNHDGLLLAAEKLAFELRRRGDDWADKDAAYRALEEVQKTLLAEVFLEHEGSVAERESAARSSIKFRQHLSSIADARKEANRAKVAYDVYRVYVDMTRTNASSQRALVELR